MTAAVTTPTFGATLSAAIASYTGLALRSLELNLLRQFADATEQQGFGIATTNGALAQRLRVHELTIVSALKKLRMKGCITTSRGKWKTHGHTRNIHTITDALISKVFGGDRE